MAKSMNTKKGAPAKPKSLAAAVPLPYATSTERGKAHLVRLTQTKGKRVVVDLNAAERVSLEQLVDTGYAANQSEAIRKAITEAACDQQTQKSRRK